MDLVDSLIQWAEMNGLADVNHETLVEEVLGIKLGAEEFEKEENHSNPIDSFYELPKEEQDEFMELAIEYAQLYEATEGLTNWDDAESESIY